MRLLWLYLVFSLYFPKNIFYPLPQPEKVWKQSRYIIDNRRNLLFKKPFLALYANINPIASIYSKSANVTLNKNDEAFREVQKDVSIEESVKNEYYNEYLSKNLFKTNTENFFYKTKDTKQNQNYTGMGFNTQNVVQNEEDIEFSGSQPKNLIKINHNENIDKEMLEWTSNQNENIFVTNAHTRGPFIIGKPLVSSQEVKNDFNDLNRYHNNKFDFEESRNAFAFAPVDVFSTSPSNFWDNISDKTKSETGIGKNAEPEEKHVYETRIETVSYHREVSFNSPQNKPEMIPKKNYKEKSNYGEREKNYEENEKNYEVDEAIHVMTNGRFHGPTSPEVEDDNNNKFGFVVEGKNYRRYRVEERTSDGFLVGEYGVVSHNDGSLRGVRYTADSTANPQLIYQALINFLSL